MAQPAISVLAFVKYGNQAASTRQRLLQYLPYLRTRNIHVRTSILLDNTYVRRIGTETGPPAFGIASSYATRLLDVLSAPDCDLIWVYGELFPYLPGFFERLAHVRGKPVIYDYDDAIFHQYDLHRHWFIRRALSRKLKPALRRAAACSCGNEYLRAYVKQFCERTLLLPTVVDADVFRPKSEQRLSDGPVVIGWIGSPSTWGYVEPLVPMIRTVCERFGARFRVIGAGRPVANFPKAENLDWSEETEVSHLQGIDIGIMPLRDDPWARGKCGYKLIQYMACGGAVVASPVGVNSKIIDHGQNGLLATSREDWEASLSALLQDADLRQRMGQSGRQKVESEYSLQVHAPRVERLMRDAVQAKRTERE